MKGVGAMQEHLKIAYSRKALETFGAVEKSRKKVGKKARTCYLSRGAENRSWQALKESEERQMNFTERRKQVFDKMDQDSALLLFSGIELHVSADEYLPFEANRNFFYLTGLRRDHMILMMKKTAKEEKSILFIEEADLNQERWFGRKVTVSEAQEITGIDDVRFLDSFEGMVNRLMAREDIGTLYFDCYRYQVEDLPDYNMVKAEEFAKKFPGRPIKNIAPVIAALRMQKDEDEIALVRQAIKITDDALKFVMKNLKPGCTEYQAQADFE